VSAKKKDLNSSMCETRGILEMDESRSQSMGEAHAWMKHTRNQRVQKKMQNDKSPAGWK